MAVTSLAYPKYTFVDANGKPLAGGLVYTYQAGTSTLATTWTDSSGSTANTNPVVLDVNGQCTIWGLTTQTYDFGVHNSGDVLQYTVQNISGAASYATFSASSGSSLVGFLQAGAGAVADTVQNELRQVLRLSQFGGKQDGTTDDLAAIQAAIAIAKATGATLKATGSIRCSSGFTISSGTYQLDFTGAVITFDAGTTVGVTVGDVGATPFSGEVLGLNIKKSAYAGSDTGILFVNATNSAIVSPTVTNFAKPYSFIPTSSSRVAYNTFINPSCSGHQYGVWAQPGTGCYVNENTFLGGRFASTVSGRLVDQIHMDNSSGTGCDHNRFMGVSVEGYSGGGSCGNSAATLVGACLGNIFSFCRGESYGTGWSSGYTYNFDASCLRNRVVDSEIGQTVNDASGLNYVDLPTTGVIASDAIGGVAHPVFKYTRQVANTDNVKKFAINITDTYSSSGKVGFLYYSSPIGESRAGKLVSLNTGYGEVHAMDDAGTILPKDNFANLGGISNRWQYIYTFYFRQTPVTVASLPAAGTITAGGRAFVSDATATTFASVVAGGGTNNVPVYSDGTNWRIG